MNDDDLPMSAELANASLASAYLDGELDASQHAAAESDPQTMAAIASFNRVRTILADNVSPADSTRTAAVAAAMAEFDTLRMTPGRTTPVSADLGHDPQPEGKVIAFAAARRLRAFRVVSAVAAAAVVVVVIGVAALSNSTSDEKSSSAPATLLTNAQAAEATGAASAKAIPSSDSGNADLPASAAASQATETLPAIADGPALLAFAQAQMAATTTLDASVTATVPSPAATAAAPAATTVAESPTANGFAGFACALTADQRNLGAIAFQGTPAHVVVADSTGLVTAIADDCRVLATVSP
jgi:negative regulator of sigma E activity